MPTARTKSSQPDRSAPGQKVKKAKARQGSAKAANGQHFTIPSSYNERCANRCGPLLQPRIVMASVQYSGA